MDEDAIPSGETLLARDAARWLAGVAGVAIFVACLLALGGIGFGMWLVSRHHNVAGLVTIGASIVSLPAALLPGFAGVAFARYIEMEATQDN